MNNLKNNISKALLVLSVLFVLSSCKKDKDTNKDDSAKVGTFSYQSKTMDIKFADYRGGDGDGAWIYFMTSDYNALFIRFSNLGDYVIPEGTFTLKNTNPYNAALNFRGGQVLVNNVGDEMTSGTVVIKKTGDSYKITINANTAKGPVTGNFDGTLKKI
jgi:hypothetical protein